MLWLQVEASCKHRCLEDLTSTTRFVTWSLHTKTHKALKSMMGKLQAADPTRLGAAGSGSSNKSGHQQGHENSNGAAGVMIDMLESTLWQRQLGSLPEETVGALVAQVSGKQGAIREEGRNGREGVTNKRNAIRVVYASM